MHTRVQPHPRGSHHARLRALSLSLSYSQSWSPIIPLDGQQRVWGRGSRARARSLRAPQGPVAAPRSYCCSAEHLFRPTARARPRCSSHPSPTLSSATTPPRPVLSCRARHALLTRERRDATRAHADAHAPPLLPPPRPLGPPWPPCTRTAITRPFCARTRGAPPPTRQRTWCRISAETLPSWTSAAAPAPSPQVWRRLS